MQGANMDEIVKMAQQVASSIAQNQSEPIDPKNMDMGKVISQVTNSVSKMITPEMIEKMSGQMSGQMGGFDTGSSMEQMEQLKEQVLNTSSKKFKSKINFHANNEEVPEKKSLKNKKNNSSSSIEELDDESDSECKPLAPRTKDLNFTLNVTLEELYAGKTKKLAVRRKRLVTDGKKKTLVEEKKKISVNIEPGMFDEQVITFNKQADEREGYETGDIVITLCCAEHDEFEREGNNLLIEREISLSEAYDCKMTITHLDGREINVISNQINPFGEELECYRKLKRFGMPIYGSEKDEYGDLIIKFKPTLPDNLTSEQLVTLNELFPKMNEIKELSKENNHELELATESDFEYSDSEDEDSDDESEYSDEESDFESSEFEVATEDKIEVS
jgi:DnaJ-class molecular chaperone